MVRSGKAGQGRGPQKERAGRGAEWLDVARVQRL